MYITFLQKTLLYFYKKSIINLNRYRYYEFFHIAGKRQEMDIKDMRAFYAIVEEGNISHAAQRLDIAQPALSRQMKRLETSLGVQLFERGSRRIRLTDAGRVMYTRVEHILGMVDGTVREITEIGSGIAGSIRLGTITTSGALLLPELISEFHSRYPNVTYQIGIRSSDTN